MNIVRVVALLTGLVPIIAIHTTYLISASQGYVPWCFPYIESCSSISATGRHGAAFYVFKGTMIPAAVLLMIYWFLTSRWLGALGDVSKAGKAVLVLGILGAAFLIVYTVALGASGDHFRLQRRIGIIFYFTFTYLSQLLVVWRLNQVMPGNTTQKIMFWLCALTLSIGLVTILLDLSIDNYDDYEDAFEWVLALLIHLYFLVSVKLFAQTNFRIRYEVH